jgi:hypothetical protein
MFVFHPPPEQPLQRAWSCHELTKGAKRGPPYLAILRVMITYRVVLTAIGAMAPPSDERRHGAAEAKPSPSP